MYTGKYKLTQMDRDPREEILIYNIPSWDSLYIYIYIYIILVVYVILYNSVKSHSIIDMKILNNGDS